MGQLPAGRAGHTLRGPDYTAGLRPIPHLLAWTVGIASAETQTTAAEREALGRHARSRRSLVELGVWHGVTTAILRGQMDPGGVLWAVDPFPAGRLGFNAQRPIALWQVSRVRNGRVEWVRTTSVEAAARYRQERGAAAEFVFIDGDHTYESAAADWRAWSPLIVSGGVVCLHDSHSTSERDIEEAGSVKAANELVLTDPGFRPVEVVDTLTVVRRQ